MFRKILVPVDGSASSMQGLDEALALARDGQAQLVLLHVVEAMPPMGMEMATAETWQAVLDSLRKQGEEVLQKAAEHARSKGARVETQLELFPNLRVADAILKAAGDRQCDLVAMGTHGRRGFSHLMLGSDAERVVRASPVPVLLVRQKAAGHQHECDDHRALHGAGAASVAGALPRMTPCSRRPASPIFGSDGSMMVSSRAVISATAASTCGREVSKYSSIHVPAARSDCA